MKNEDFVVLVKGSEKRYTLGVVYEPDVADTQNEFAKAEDIEQAAWDFMARMQAAGQFGQFVFKAALSGDEAELDVTEMEEMFKSQGLDDEHLQVTEPLGDIVESYIAPCDMTIGEQLVKKGTWMLGVCWNEQMFEKIKKGERTGLSMFGLTRRVKA